MKIEHEIKEKKFEPFKIAIETEEEAMTFWVRFLQGDISFANGFGDPIMRAASATLETRSIFNKLSEEMERQGITRSKIISRVKK